MSDKRLVEIDNKRVARVMTTAIARSHRMLVSLTTANHRGPADTWTAARDRTARQLGIEETYAARIWHRWQTMKDVSGEAFMRLKDAYDAECLKHERAAEHYRSLREGTLHGREIDQEPAFAGVGVAALEGQQAHP